MRQIHGPVQHRLARHLADHRLGEVGDLGTEKTFLLEDRFCHGASLAHSAGSTTAYPQDTVAPGCPADASSVALLYNAGPIYLAS